jgi:hypothetical protein
MIAYKFLSRGASGLFSRFEWPTPAGEAPGEWVRVEGEVKECLNGIHACPPARLAEWIDEELWEIELEDPVVEADGSLLAPAGRLTRRIAGWDDQCAGSFVTFCVEKTGALAADSLARTGRAAEAEVLAASRSGPDAEQNVLELARTFEDEAPSPVLFMADLKRLQRGTRPELADEAPAEYAGGPTPSAVAANLGFVCAHIAAQLAEEERAGAYAETFERERLSQSTWLAEKLRLADHR